MKKLIALAVGLALIFGTDSEAHAQSTYTVQPGDSLWIISVKYQIGLSEIIGANPQISNPDLIYPNQKINIPKSQASSAAGEVIKLTNAERAKHGLSPLKADWQLSRVARYKAWDMHDKNYFSHTSPTYGSPFDMMKAFGINYRSAGENIARGQRTPREVVNAWMNSSGHRANILNANYTHIGVGYAESGNYWVQMFIRK
ncbi:SafA/ExsA family spore coat assembly protein [Lentibacillus saliphilus]|uniref:SafA/ExsA family spore coat assembly protein n=1 Tax=Lentibacillus saliphilus TaxID=2737028 RepID=UPI001C2F1E68|nr:SafA/ExsA family spore coat assembly protein [Lentibacillus saliphilus]